MRFLSADPAGPSAAEPLSLNAYTYCEGDPIGKSDPSGAVTIGDAMTSTVWGVLSWTAKKYGSKFLSKGARKLLTKYKRAYGSKGPKKADYRDVPGAHAIADVRAGLANVKAGRITYGRELTHEEGSVGELGYYDVNFSTGGFLWLNGLTMGILVDRDTSGVHPYLGGGLMLRSPSWSVTSSDQSVTHGLNVGSAGQAMAGLGVAGQVGLSREGVFEEHGVVGVGAGWTILAPYRVW